jgi:hypothetical protein
MLGRIVRVFEASFRVGVLDQFVGYVPIAQRKRKRRTGGISVNTLV